MYSDQKNQFGQKLGNEPGSSKCKNPTNPGYGHSSQALLLFIFLLLVFEAAQSGEGGLIPVLRVGRVG